VCVRMQPDGVTLPDMHVHGSCKDPDFFRIDLQVKQSRKKQLIYARKLIAETRMPACRHACTYAI